jgi:predicted aspartyl protease
LDLRVFIKWVLIRVLVFLIPTLPPDNSSPKIEVELYGIYGRQTPPQVFNAIIDTGFTGGISIPILQALPLGLVLRTTANFTLADGSLDSTYICLGIARLGDIEKVVAFSLSKGSDILIGTEFLKMFEVKLDLDYKLMTITLAPQ